MYSRSGVLALFVVCFAALAPGVWADGSIHGNIGSESYIYVNAVGDDQGNGSTRSANVTGEYSITGLPADRWYLMNKGLYKFYLPEGADLEINDDDTGAGFPAAYNLSYAPNYHKSRRIGQTFLANAEYLKSISTTQALEPKSIHCCVYEDGPGGNLVWDAGYRSSGELFWWAVWVVNPPRSIKLIPGKRYYVEFSADSYMMIPYFSANPYLDGMTYVMDEGTHVMIAQPESDITMTVGCQKPGLTDEYYSHGASEFSWVHSVYQTFTATGESMRKASFFLPWDPSQSYSANGYMFSLHEFGGMENPVGPQVGPTKRAKAGMDYSDGCGAVWDAGECPLVPGREYLIKVEKADGFVAWHLNNDPSGQGYYFRDGNYVPGASLNGNINSDEVPLLPLTISSLQASNVGATSALITWNTSSAAMTQVEFWTYEGDHQHTVLDENLSTSHSVQLTRLMGDTTYYFKAKSYREGYVYAEDEGSFHTTPAGLLFGTVRDTSGQPVIGAHVETSPGPFGTYETTTASDGSYFIEHVQPGNYDVTASREGLISATVQYVQVVPGDATNCDITMQRIGEFVANGGFETGDFTGWPYITYTAASGGTPEPPGVHCSPPDLLSLVPPHSGSCIMNRATNWWGHNGWVGQRIDVEPGRTYRLTAYYCIYWVQGDENAVRMWLMIDPKGRETYTYADIVRSPMLTWPTEGDLSPWIPVSVECTAESNRVTAWIQYFQNVGEWRICCWDDVTISRVLDTIAEAKAHMDDSRVTLKGLVVTATKSQLQDKIYVEAQDRVSGIQLYLNDQECTLNEGDIITVEGILATRDGEKCLTNCIITQTGTTTPLAPLAIGPGCLGGPDFEYDAGPPASGQQGVEGAYGVNNVGLLVRCAGKVVFAGETYFVLNDGSFEGSTGVKVLLPAGAGAPAVGSIVGVTGISGLTIESGTAVPVLRVREAGDLDVVLEPPQ